MISKKKKKKSASATDIASAAETPKYVTDPEDDNPAAEVTKKAKMKKPAKEEEDKTKKKKEMEMEMETEEALPKDPDNDIGASPIDNPGHPEDVGNDFHPPPPSPTALHLQGPFPDG